MRILSRTELLALADPAALVRVLAAAMQRVSARQLTQPPRSVLPLAPGKLFAVMPGAREDPPGFGAKLLSLFADNPRHGRPSHAGVMLLFDSATGLPAACLEASALTALRTAAASAAATDALARPEATRLAILGCGEQAEFHLAAMHAVRPLTRIDVWGRDPAKAAAFAAAHPGVTMAPSVAAAVAQADIICTTTAATAPVLLPGLLPAGVHVNAVGASRPPAMELAPECLAELTPFCDFLPSLDAEAADYIAARAAGLVRPAVEIGDVFSGAHPGRQTPAERTLYRSLGIAAQDLAAAAHLLARAEAAGIGCVVDLA